MGPTDQWVAQGSVVLTVFYQLFVFVHPPVPYLVKKSFKNLGEWCQDKVPGVPLKDLFFLETQSCQDKVPLSNKKAPNDNHFSEHLFFSIYLFINTRLKKRMGNDKLMPKKPSKLILII